LIDRRLLYAAGLAYALNFIAQAVLPAYAFPRSFFASHLILLFGMGMLAARAVRSSLSLPYCGYIAVAAATAFFGVGMVATMNRVGYNKAPFDLAYGAVSMVLVWALVRYEQSRPSLAVLRSFALMGASSYALYLIHFPLIAILSKVAVAVLPKSSVGALTAFVAMVGVCAVVSMAFHAGVERRVIRWFRPGNRSRASAS
jgi:peptidoglycan/LPS O-acetylase OafA/YrhL